MGNLIYCTAVALNIFSMPAGTTVVGQVPAYKAVYLMDGSLMRDWVFIGKPGPDGVSPRGWVKYEYLGPCQYQGTIQDPNNPTEEEIDQSNEAHVLHPSPNSPRVRGR